MMKKHLKDVYGYNHFREYQQDIVEDIIKNNDVFAILPTGGGKSLLYQFPATYTDKTTVVISPLISLMNDQCMNLKQKKIKAACLNSESTICIESLSDFTVLFTTPEYFVNSIYVFENIQASICLIAIDEAHCLSQWGHDFRPSYKKLDIIKTTFPDIPLLAVTATATPKVLSDMHAFLCTNEIIEYNIGTRRDNLDIKLLNKTKNMLGDLKQHIHTSQSTIIYVPTRKICDKINALLNTNGIESVKYHGGMTPRDKQKNHETFVNDDVYVIVATVSFGMGIDKPNIRTVINYGCPTNIETYYQEIGRAGRDGIRSNAIMLHDKSDFNTSLYFIGQTKDEKEKKHNLNMLEIIQKYISELNICRQQMIDYYFSNGKFSTEIDVSDIPICKRCDNCLRNEGDKIDISNDCVTVYTLIHDMPYSMGITKLVLILRGSKDAKIKREQSNPHFGVFVRKDKSYCHMIIDTLISKNILKYSSFNDSVFKVIDIGPNNIYECLPIKCHMSKTLQNQTYVSNSCFDTYANIRKKLSKQLGVKPYMIINDRTLQFISNKKPKHVSELWMIDGITQDFITKYAHFFINSG